MLKLPVFIGYITIQKVIVNMLKDFSIKLNLNLHLQYIEMHKHHVNSSLWCSYIWITTHINKSNTEIHCRKCFKYIWIQKITM